MEDKDYPEWLDKQFKSENYYTPESCYPCMYSSFVCRNHCEAWANALRWGSNPEAQRKEKRNVK